MLKVLVADKFPASQQHALQALGVEVSYQPDLTPDTLPTALSDAHILCVRSTKVTADAIEQACSLMLIVRVGSGYNTIDVAEASRRGIYVANCPGKNAIAVAELTLGLLLSIDRHIPAATQSLRDQQWEKKRFSKADGLKGKTFGVVGLGRIGQAVLQRARAFEMDVVAWSRSLTPTTAKIMRVGYCETIADLCQQADVISVHLPATPNTQHLFDEGLFAQCKPNAIFLNTSRGALHDQDALLHAMNEKGLRVGLDVFAQEPNKSTDRFEAAITQHPNFVGTPHIGASTTQAQVAVASEAVRIVQHFLQFGDVPNCVNLESDRPTQSQLIVRHFNRVGVLARIMDILRRDDINIEQMANTIFQSGQAAVATMQLDRRPSTELLQQLRAMDDVILQVNVTTVSNTRGT